MKIKQDYRKLHYELQLSTLNNILNKALKAYKVEALTLYFDFTNSTIKIEDRKFKVVECGQYTFDIKKNQINCINGLEGFYKFINKAIDADNPFHTSCFDKLLHIYNSVRACK